MCPTVICETAVSVPCEFCGGTDNEPLKCRSNAMASVRKLYPSQQPSNEVMDEDIAQELALIDEQLQTSIDTDLLYDLKEQKAALLTYVDGQPSAFKQGILETVPCMCCDSEHHCMLSCPVLQADKEFEEQHPELFSMAPSESEMKDNDSDCEVDDLSDTDFDGYSSMIAIEFVAQMVVQ